LRAAQVITALGRRALPFERVPVAVVVVGPHQRARVVVGLAGAHAASRALILPIINFDLPILALDRTTLSQTMTTIDLARSIKCPFPPTVWRYMLAFSVIAAVLSVHIERRCSAGAFSAGFDVGQCKVIATIGSISFALPLR